MSDTNCPYCDAEVEINHDDGYGYDEGETHQQTCRKCDTAITYMTGYSDGREWAAAPIPQQPSVPEGWKLVPIEPTEAMLEVGFFAENDVFDSAKTKRIHVWKDMLSAAPQPKDMK